MEGNFGKFMVYTVLLAATPETETHFYTAAFTNQATTAGQQRPMKPLEFLKFLGLEVLFPLGSNPTNGG